MKYKKYLLLVILFFVLAFQSVNAQEVSPMPPTPTPIQYMLPYPGILPGHPFYFLKNARDAVVGFLMSNPVKRAEYDLLQSDKNMQATVLLTEQKKNSTFVFSTLDNSESYFANAIRNAGDAKKQGINIKDFTTRLTLANLKHQEVVLGLAKAAKGDDKKRFTAELEEVKQLGQKVKAL